MPGHQTEYRGYRIKAERVGRVCLVSVTPKVPDLPLMRKHSYEIRASSVEEALVNVRTRIDLLLDLLR
jgi:hypothetical protein